MRILLVTGSYPPMHCGVGDYTARLASALIEDSKVEVAVLTSQFTASAVPAAPAEVLRVVTTWHANKWRFFESVIRRVDSDIVHIQFPTQGYDNWSGLAAIAWIARVRQRLPVVATMHEFLPRTTFGADRWIYALALIANRLIVVRPGFHATMPRLLRGLVAEDRLQFIGNASVTPVATLNDAERAATRDDVGCRAASLIAFFGFSYPHKGVDLLFRIADPRRHHLLLIGELKPDDPYHAQLRALASSREWQGRVTITGFVDSERAAKLLAAADAAVFPYRNGGGMWNSSLHAAISQGTFVLTTSIERNGLDAASNIYYAHPGNVEEMKRALLQYQGTRKEPARQNAWTGIARDHKALYSSLTQGKASR